MKEYIPSDLSHLSRTAYITSPKDATTWNAVGVNPRMRIYKYHKGQSFPEHIDYKVCFLHCLGSVTFVVICIFN